PPSPPEGPPRGTNFSRRKATAPAPPSPAFTKISASSMNCMAIRRPRWSRPPGTTARPRYPGRCCNELRLRLRLHGLDVHVDAVAPALLVLHGSFDHRVEREIPAHLDPAAGVHAGADLTHEDVPRHHGLASEDLDAPVLSRRVAPVARRALTFLVRHVFDPFDN